MVYRPSILANIKDKNTQIYHRTITNGGMYKYRALAYFFKRNIKRHIDMAH